jgi:O-antigen ligase
LLIPLVMATAFTPRQVLQIGYGFLAACVILVALSWASFLWLSGPWTWFKTPGVPVKDNAVQSGCFALCAFGLAIGATRIWAQGDKRNAITMIALALLFFADVFLIYISKTGAIMAAALLGLFLLQVVEGWRRVVSRCEKRQLRAPQGRAPTQFLEGSHFSFRANPRLTMTSPQILNRGRPMSL